MVKLHLFAFASCITLILATSFTIADPAPKVNAGAICDLPAPKNIEIKTLTTFYFEIAWDAVPGAAFYRISLFNSTDDVMAVTKVVTAAPDRNLARISGLVPGVSYYYNVFSICSNGMESPKSF